MGRLKVGNNPCTCGVTTWWWKDETGCSTCRGDGTSERGAYRRTAGEMFPDVKVSDHAHVHPMADGAFVEVMVWIPREKLHA